MERQKGRVVEQQFVGEGRVESALEAGVDQLRRQFCVAGHPRFRNSQPFFDRAVIVLRAPDAEGGHGVEKEIRPVFNGKGDDDIGFSARESGAELSIVAEKIVCLLLGAASVQAVIPGAWLAAQAKTIGMIHSKPFSALA